MTLPEAIWTVCQNKHGIAMSFWNEYLPAVLIVDAAFPITHFKLTDSEEDDRQFENELLETYLETGENKVQL